MSEVRYLASLTSKEELELAVPHQAARLRALCR
jgi:hypothetical protein